MVTIREIKNLDDLKSFYSVEPDAVHIVKIGAPWCGPCRTLSDTLHNLDNNKINGALIADVNIDEDDNEDIAVEYNIRSIPVTLFVKNNEVMEKFVGAITSETIYKTIEQYK